MDKKEKIILAASELFAEKGYKATTVREICSAARTNISMISYYFGSKEKLYREIISYFTKKTSDYIYLFIDKNTDIDAMSKHEKISVLLLLMDKLIEFFYKRIPSNCLKIIFYEQQNMGSAPNAPVYELLRKILASLLHKDKDDKEVVFGALNIIAPVATPRIMLSFSLKALKRKYFDDGDLATTRKHARNNLMRVLNDYGVYDD